MIRATRCFVLLAGLAAAAGCSDTTGSGERYLASLNGQQALPPNPSAASGTGRFDIVDGGAIDFAVTVQTITGVTAVRLQQGQPGAAGTVILDLYTNVTGTPPIASAVLASGRITANDLAAVSMDSLQTLFRNQAAFVTVHTLGVPGGEIRGHLYRN